MGYYATTRDGEIKISDINGLYSYYDDWGEATFERVLDLLNHNFCGTWTKIGEDQTLYYDSYEKYYDDEWREIAPYIEGYIGWIGEDDCIWRDNFSGGEMSTEYPHIAFGVDDTIEAFYYMARHAEALVRCGSIPDATEDVVMTAIWGFAEGYALNNKSLSCEKYLEDRFAERGWL